MNQALSNTIKSWPVEVLDFNTAISAVQGELKATIDDPLLLECIGELWVPKRD